MSQWKFGYQENRCVPFGGNVVDVTPIARLVNRSRGGMPHPIAEVGEGGSDGVDFFGGTALNCEGRSPEFRGLLDGAGLNLVSPYRTVHTGPARPYSNALWPISVIVIGYGQNPSIELYDIAESIIDSGETGTWTEVLS